MKSRPAATGKIAKKTQTPLKQQAVIAEAVHEAAADSNRLRDHITARAYALYEERGYRHGCELQDWLDAEREILSRQQPA